MAVAPPVLPLPPRSAAMPAAADIRDMFARVARRYDFANLLLSGGFSKHWTARLADSAAKSAAGSGSPALSTTSAVPPVHHGRCATTGAAEAAGATAAGAPLSVADLATGSGDVAFALAERLAATGSAGARITGLDFCEPMLAIARERAQSISHPTLPVPHFALGDCLDLPLPDASQDIVTIAYGVRNFQDRARGLREIFRVLKPGGSAHILEFSQPRRWLRPFYYFYLRALLPLIARAATGDKSAYQYLGASISAFPDAPAFAAELRAAGFATATFTRPTLGIVAIHKAVK